MPQIVREYEDQNDKCFGDPAFVKQYWSGKQLDTLLQWIIGEATVNPGKEFPITITVGGNLISGNVISLESYLQLLLADLEGFLSRECEVASAMKQQVEEWGVHLDGDISDFGPSQHIHLKDTEVFTTHGSPIMPGGSLWRGKLTSVDGFQMGRLKFSEG
ncbi:gas vesicle protein [Pseudomonas plecoglossicida]|uniref:Gas vesicle protein n=2 Tax=Pseudomonas TaxID=286 RepID=A0A2A3M790_PSEDL|nr:MULTISPECIES: gas vesicle protein [Pseudomonas]MDD2110055.1 gas vesicle protein [Pseudomonas asiatica]MDM9587730.1 gas vesicle protein [Pseudomonas asiatica]PBJ95970.1 gas vesicle protein [Pseudomonas plecoglossicida]